MKNAHRMLWNIVEPEILSPRSCCTCPARPEFCRRALILELGKVPMLGQIILVGRMFEEEVFSENHCILDEEWCLYPERFTVCVLCFDLQ